MMKTPRLVLENSTHEPLGANETWCGAWTDVSEYTSVTVSCKADADGRLYMEFSDSKESEEADSSLGSDVHANINEVHTLKRTRQFCRTKFVNGQTPQTKLGINTFFENGGMLVAPRNLILGQDADAIPTRSSNFEQEVAESLRAGYSVVNIFGRNDNIATGSVPEDVWNGGGVYTGFPIGNFSETLEVFSSSANDTSAGSGARTVLLYGLDGATKRPITELVTLNGVTPVQTVNQFYRMNKAIVISSGNGNQNFNAGSITARGSTTTSAIFMVMPAGTNRTQIACYTNPDKTQLYVNQFGVEMDRSSSSNANGAIWVRNFGESPRLIRQFSVSQSGPFKSEILGGLSFGPLTDIAVRITSVSLTGTSVTSYFDGYQVEQ